MKTTISVLAMLMAASVASADGTTTHTHPAPTSPVSASIEFDVTKNTSDKYVGKTTLGFELEGTGPAFGGFELKAIDGTISIGDWNIGTAVAGATVSLGKQGDLFPSAGLEVVGSTTLANPTVNESVIATAGGLSVMAGFDSLSTDVTDLDNVQASYDFEVGIIGMGAAVDYNTDTKEKSYGVSSSLDLTTDMSIGGTATYAANKLGYEVNATAGVISMFANGDEDNKLQHIGAGVKGSLNGLDLYAEASYDTDAEDLTPAIGASFKF
jgi:hypothetical protein